MAQNNKYRVSNMAKDLNVKGKDLVDLLGEKGFAGKTNMTVLEPDDFGLVLNELSAARQVDNIDGYFNGELTIEPPEAREVKEPKKPKEPAREKSGAPSSDAKAENAAKAQPQQTPKGEAKPRPQQAQQTQQQSRPAAKQQQPDNRAQSQRSQQFSKPPQTLQQPKKQPAPKKPAPAPQQPAVVKPQSPAPAVNETIVEQDVSRSRGATRVVDTRTSSVDLSKYDEKNELLLSSTDDKHDSGAEKQKLSKQRNGFRDAGSSKGSRDGKSGTRDGKSNARDGRSDGRNSKNDRERQAMEKLKKQKLEKARKAPLQITIPEEIVVGELASRLKVTASEVIKRLMMLGVMANVNAVIDYDTAYLVADEMGAQVTREVVVTIEDRLFDEEGDSEDQLVERPPVVVVMGHVDHGKTSLLDRIRHTHVTAGEAGGITQHIGAYTVSIDGKPITFLDTPGHEAFTAMRARGAKATDIAILVVAADDGIMPQTIEAIHHAKDAGLEIIVAINKMDKPGASPDSVKQELTKYDLIPEEWGGDVMCVPVSALTGLGIDELLENILLIAEMKEYKANPNRRAQGIVIESKLDKGRGPVATVLVQNGTLNNGDVIIAGTAVGRVRAMTDDKGKQVKTAGPSVPVEIFGLDEVPAAGNEFKAVEDERMARELAEQRRTRAKDEEFKANAKVSLDDLFAAISDGVKELKIIVKADVAGSAEAVKSSLLKLSNEEVKINIIHAAVGGITEGDVMFAAASNAIIVGFNVRPDKNALDSAERQNVDIRTYRVIYDCIEEIGAAMKGMLAPTYKEELLGHAEVRQTIHVPNVGTIAGSYVQDGKITRSAQIRVLRDSVVIFEDKISSLKRFKDDVREVAQGYECGIGLDRFNDIKVGDVLEAFEMVEVKR